jgi:hypothetical protein
MLTFDESTHAYFWNGIRVPGVTAVLNDFMRVEIGGTSYHIGRNSGAVIPSDVMEKAAAIGTDIHEGCRILANGWLDWSAIDGAYVGPLKQFELWREQYRPHIMFTETPFYSLRYGYAGTIDIIAMINGKLSFIDIKTGASSSVGPQLAAYERGWCEQEKYTAATQRWALWLPKNGDPFKFERLTGKHDFDYFRSCLYQYNYLKGGRTYETL